MKVFFAADHAGFALKGTLMPFVERLGHEVEDVGAHAYDEDDDYPDIIAPAAQQVSLCRGACRAIVIGGSGQGEAMVANRFPCVRAAVITAPHEDLVRLSREHNDANVLSLGARFLTEEEAKEVVRLWLATEFPHEECHARRILKIEQHSSYD